MLPMPALCQWQAELYAGLANYQGDLQSKKFSFSPVKPALGVGLTYRLFPKIFLRASLNYMEITGGDNIKGANKNNRFRNLSFNTRILEAQVAAEYDLFDVEYRTFSPYVFAGIGFFQFNPWVKDADGKKIFLQDLGTEGQGVPQYPERKEYQLVQVMVPFGGGVKTAISPRVQVGVELGFRKLFTDYLDDVSTTYADSALLAANNGPLAVQYAYRGDELAGGGAYPAAGSQRGNPKNKDWYYTTVLRISYRFEAYGSGNKANRTFRSKVGCPYF